MDGVPGSQVKDKIAAAERRKAELEGLLERAVDDPVILHPNMAKLRSKQVEGLCEGMSDEGRRTEASTIIRSLVERIVLRPANENGERALAIDLEGHLAGILSLAAQTKMPLTESNSCVREITLVAEAGFGLCALFAVDGLRPPQR